MKRRFVLTAVLGLAAVLLSGNAIQAQSRLFGYYYPDERRFNGPALSTAFTDHIKNVPMWAPIYRRSGTAVAMAPVPTPAAKQASVRVLLPDARAVVWFGDYQTRSTGTERVYQTPALTPGSHIYQLKVSYVQNGQELALERTITVTSGQTVVVDLTPTAIAELRSDAR